MRITFIRPNLWGERSSDAMQPLVFAILAALTQSEHQISFYDENLESDIFDYETDLVAMTVETYTARRAYQIATKYRQRGIPVIMGGFHPSFLPNEALAFADSVVIGDAETVWKKVLSDARNDNLQRVYRGSNNFSLEGLVFDRSIFQGKRYSPIMPIQYGRGCRFACDFCSINAFYGNHQRQRPIPDIIKEIGELDSKLFLFIDDNLFNDLTETKKLLRALIPLNIRWACQVSIDIANHTQILDLMARSGCIAVLIGFESLNADNLKQMKKKWNLKDSDYLTAIKKFQDRGIMIYGSFIFGYDHDTVDSFDITVEFAIRSKFCLSNFNTLTPTPGAKLYEKLKREKRLIYDRWWLDPDFRYGMATFHPKNMTADELTEGCFQSRKKFNKYSSILLRASDFKTNCQSPFHLGAYLLANFIFRKEIFKKQGIQLGSNEPLRSVLDGK